MGTCFLLSSVVYVIYHYKFQVSTVRASIFTLAFFVYPRIEMWKFFVLALAMDSSSYHLFLLSTEPINNPATTIIEIIHPSRLLVNVAKSIVSSLASRVQGGETPKCLTLTYTRTTKDCYHLPDVTKMNLKSLVLCPL